MWSSEIEQFPMDITKKWFPETKQLGDITKIDGAAIESVDIICAGSPCQDLSIAGNRAGLAGERSGLFVKSIEILRAMREATGGKQPRWFVWENVPGAFSSHQGEDFRTVLEQIGQADIPVPQSHKWAQAGMVRTEAADICWRVLDAQYWGVPQRRKRIFLVADFGERRERRAGEVLFDTEGMCGNPAEGGASGETAADATESCAPKTSLTPWDIQGRHIYDECGVSQTLSGCDGGGGQRGSVNIFQHSKPLVQSKPQGGPIVLKIRQPRLQGGGRGPLWQEDMSYCLARHQDQTLFEATNYSNFRKTEVSRTISTGTEHKHLENIVVEKARVAQFEKELPNSVCNQKCFGASAFATFKESDVASTLKAQGGDLGGGSENFVINDEQKGVTAT